MERFASRLRELRMENDLRQKDLADKLGYARTTIANYEQALRFPPIDTLFEIADFFQVSLDYLLGRTHIRLSPEKIIYDRVKVPILVIDPKSGKIFDCNDIAVDFYGYEKVELLNMDIYSINILSREEINEKMNNAVSQEKGSFRLKHRLASGIIKDVQVFSGPLLIDNKNYLYSVIYDVTAHSERKSNLLEINTNISPLIRLFNYRYPNKTKHHQRVASISSNIGASLEIDSESLNYIDIAASVHDIGWLMLPVEIVNNFGKLSDSELNIFRKHPVYGAELIHNIDSKLSRIIKQHHEYTNGTGYPDGLTEDDIMPEAKILTVADTIDLLSLDQGNKNISAKDYIISYLEDYKGLHFDRIVTEKAIELIKDSTI